MLQCTAVTFVLQPLCCTFAEIKACILYDDIMQWAPNLGSEAPTRGQEMNLGLRGLLIIKGKKHKYIFIYLFLLLLSQI